MAIKISSIQDIHHIFEFDDSASHVKDVRKRFFVAACFYFDRNTQPDIALKLRPCGGLLGIDNSIGI